MTANPVDLIGGITTTANVPKADFTAWAKARVPQVLADAAELRNTLLAGQLVVSLKLTLQSYYQDTSDTTTSDDGVNCIISADGKRFKPTTEVLPPGVPANVPNTVLADYPIEPSDAGKTIQAGTGSTGFFKITLPSVTGFAANAVVTIVNGDTTRGKRMVGFPTGADFILWMKQSITVGIVNGAWAILSWPGRYKPPAAAVLSFYCDFTNGTDAIGATDGLAPGAAAFKSAERVFLNAADQIDDNAASQTQVLCNMAPATADTQGMHSPVHAMVGAQGGAAFQVVGASLAISGVVSNGGLCKITVPSTATYTANQVVSIYGVQGATGCNGTWKVTVTDSTHLTLQGTTFGGTYTSGGTVTNGSSFNTTGVDCVDVYFGTVLQFANVTFVSTSNCLGAVWGSKVYIQQGNIFGSCGGAHLLINSKGQVHIDGDIGIAASASNAFIQAQTQGLLASDGSFNINFVPGINPSFSGLGFAYADTQGQANFNGITINLNGNTVTGQRFQAITGGFINSGTGLGSLTFFPGSTAGIFGSGGQYDLLTNPVSSPTITSTNTGTASITSGGGFTASDSSQNSNALKMGTLFAIAANSNGIACPPTTSGLVMVSDNSVSGTGALFFIAATGSIQLLTTGSVWSNTTTPAASHFGFAWDGTNFRIYNGFGSSVNFRALSITTA